MPKRHSAGKCGSSNCCASCKCDGAPLGTTYITLANVAMNATPAAYECISPRFGQTIDQSWYNGVTFAFNQQWNLSQFQSNNPNGFDDFHASTLRCTFQLGYWECVYELGAIGDPDKKFWWGAGVTWAQQSFGPLKYTTVVVILNCGTRLGTGARTTTSQGVASYAYALSSAGCPVGSYSLSGRSDGAFPASNTGPFDFRSFTATLAWL